MSLPRILRSSSRVSAEQVGALEEDLAGDVGVAGVQQAHDREARDALARARLADDAERLAAAQRERERPTRLTTPSRVRNGP